MMEDAVNAVRAWLGKARGNDDGAEFALWILRLRASERSAKSSAIARGARPAAA